MLIHSQAISSRPQVLRGAQEKPDIFRCKLAVALGASYYCIKALVDRGYVKVGNFAASKNKFGYACLLVPAGVAENSRLTAASIASKLDENNAPHEEINALVECGDVELVQFGGAFW